MSARLCAEADVPCGLGEFSGVWALDGTTFQASDTEENRVEWPYASGPLIVKLEVGVLILACNLMRYVIARGRARGQRRGIASTAAAAMAFISTVPMLYAARRSLERAFSRLVAAVAADALSRRKRKNYVRAVKRRPKPYPLLTKPRSEYRQEEVI